MFHKVKTWDNRCQVKEQKLQSSCIKGRTWIRRVQWLEDGSIIKLKFDEGSEYNEIGALTEIAVQEAWEKFKNGASFAELKSIFGIGNIKVEPSRKQAIENKLSYESI